MNLKYLLITAFRDSRKDRGRLMLFMSSIVLGIAALVAINSFNYNLTEDINKQAASLLGADLVVSSNKIPAAKIMSAYDSLPGEKSSQYELMSMSYIPSVDESQFVRLMALEGNFPYYGKIQTEPESAASTFRNKQAALVDIGMMAQHGLEVGDVIKLGELEFTIEGRLKNSFGGTGMTSAFAPPIYISKEYIDRTELIQPGSMIDYTYYAKVPETLDADEWKKTRREAFRNESVRIETIEGRKEDLNEAFDSLNYFLNLVALVSLLLGCIGVASSVFIYVKNKIPSIAVFRCLGMKGRAAFVIYFMQIVTLGLIGAIIGAALGTAIQMLLPIVLKDFLPMAIEMDISWSAIFQGISIGFVITTLFAAIPLLGIRKISPLRTLRASADTDSKGKDPWIWAVVSMILLSLFGFLILLTGDWKSAVFFTIGLGIAFLILFGVSRLIIWGVKKFFPKGWSYVFRQGLSNLFRPNNQTQTLLVSIGLGTAVLTTLFIIQGLLLKNVEIMDAGNQPNTILYGIELGQGEGVAQLTKEYDMPIIQQVPIVTMRLAAWKGKSRDEWLADTTRTASRWAINRETRVTYRDTLDGQEKLVEGEFVGTVQPGDSVFISLDKGYAESLDVVLGDELIWNVQGAIIKTYVGSFREINFRQMGTRFFVLFPNGVLEEAPQFQVVVTKSPDATTTGTYRAAITKAFPNVMVVDLGNILKALSDILSKVSYIIKFMAAFSILTGLIVLLSSLILSKFQRIRESVLLRTIGASKSQIFKINATEYAVLGALSAATGIIISIVSAWLLAKYQLEMEFNFDIWPIVAVFFLVTSVTVIIGLLNSRDVINKSPLEVLRREAA